MSLTLIGTASSTGSISEDLELRVVFQQPIARERHSVCDLPVMATLPEEESSSGGLKTVQYTWRGLRMVGEASLFDLDEAVWHPDEKSPVCDRCKTHFSLLTRRHHCRRCGDVVCSDCCDKTPLSRMGYVDPVLACTNCLPICKSEEEFLTTQLKHLVHGAHFHLSDSPDPNQDYHCKLSNDHKQLVISNDHLPINMKQILEVKTISDMETSDDGSRKRAGSSSKSIGLEITYKSGGLEQKLTLSPSQTHSRKHSVEWLRALKKGLIILHK